MTGMSFLSRLQVVGAAQKIGNECQSAIGLDSPAVNA